MNITIQGVEYDSEKVIKVINGRPYLLVPSADLGGANLTAANLGAANLGAANLYGANLRNADLRYANLGCADLSNANLGAANLGGADLSGALGLDKILPYAPASLPDGYAFDPAEGIYLKTAEPVTPSCSHTQTGPYCSTCGEKL